jgi:hypothetical protein
MSIRGIKGMRITMQIPFRGIDVQIPFRGITTEILLRGIWIIIAERTFRGIIPIVTPMPMATKAFATRKVSAIRTRR